MDCIRIDPYANALTKVPTANAGATIRQTMKPELWERNRAKLIPYASRSSYLPFFGKIPDAQVILMKIGWKRQNLSMTPSEQNRITKINHPTPLSVKIPHFYRQTSQRRQRRFRNRAISILFGQAFVRAMTPAFMATLFHRICLPL